MKVFKINLGKPEWRISKDGRWKYRPPSGVWQYFIGTICTGCGALILQKDKDFKAGVPAFVVEQVFEAHSIIILEAENLKGE